MLHQLIYRSRAAAALLAHGLERLAAEAGRRNRALGISGLLVCDGDYFLQVLEGPRSAVLTLYDAIVADPRHSAVVLIRSEPVARRQFQGWRFLVAPPQSQGRRWPPRLSRSGSLVDEGEDRVAAIIDSFLCGDWRDPAGAPSAGPPPGPARARGPAQLGLPHGLHGLPALPEAPPVRFAMQPIVEPHLGRISSVELLLRGPDGEAPAALLRRLSRAERYTQDLAWKELAFAQIARTAFTGKVAINLLPGALMRDPLAAERLARMARSHGIEPQRVIVEITEEEAISQPERFYRNVAELKAAGFLTAIDDFGAGHAGLSLLTNFQPDKVKIDRQLVHDIQRSGVRQAIVRAVLDCCRRLGITVVAEGIEQHEEYAWLFAAGVRRFQGFYFARPALEAVPEIRWPAALEEAVEARVA
ncbi:MAG: diguanylate phosphodiesterase [Inhella sp.]